MSEPIVITKIDAMEAVFAVNETLRRIDRRLVDHGERVAFIACTINEADHLRLDQKTLFLLSIFHDIGAYKTDEIDRMLEFETTNVRNHSIYGYLFLKYLTPLSEQAEAILYHHSSWNTIQSANLAYGEYAALIHLADRIDVALTHRPDRKAFEQLLFQSNALFKPEYVALALQCIGGTDLLSKLTDASYHEENEKLCQSFTLNTQEALEYLKMIVYAIDFRSKHTVTHTINTVSLAINIAEHFNLPHEELEDIYLGALLHDVGKIAIPTSILEYPGKLTDEQMAIMRTHVNETKKLIHGIVPDEICQLAIRHHEKLDGSGYPLGLTGDVLSFGERIIGIADIVSALSSRRSYKEPFPKEKTLSILKKMSESQLDSRICEYIITDYDAILNATEPERLQIIHEYQMITDEFQVLKNKEI